MNKLSLRYNGKNMMLQHMLDLLMEVITAYELVNIPDNGEGDKTDIFCSMAPNSC